jgi:hypothetical protein
MAHDVFISYSNKDKPTADAICASLEVNGIRCWIAPRDIIPGTDWGESIIDAIHDSSVMILVFSSNSNTSVQIKREIERAVNAGIPVIPFRIEDVLPSKSLEYFISTQHWLDALTAPLEKHLQNLAAVMKLLLLRKGEGAVKEVKEPQFKSPAAGNFEAAVEKAAGKIKPETDAGSAPQTGRHFCSQCGTPLPADSKFCKNCGHLIDAALLSGEPKPSPVTPTPIQTIPAAASNLTQKKMIGAAFLAGLLMVATGLYWWSKAPPTKVATLTTTSLSPEKENVQVKPKSDPIQVTPPETVIASPAPEIPTAPKLPETPTRALPTRPGTWPWTSERLVTIDDLQYLTNQELEIMRNEIFARHGRLFKRSDLRQYFENQPWYQPKGTMENFEAANRLAAAEVSSLEKKNVEIIQRFEQQRKLSR